VPLKVAQLDIGPVRQQEHMLVGIVAGGGTVTDRLLSRCLGLDPSNELCVIDKVIEESVPRFGC
jgi:hypothetical protein